jgi:uncharacterized membrane protein YhiD involved in acid resistance
MMPLWWVALAYGVVAATLIAYTLGLRRRLRRYEAGARTQAGSAAGLTGTR